MDADRTYRQNYRLWGTRYASAGCWSPELFSGLISKYTREKLGISINLSTWRHMSIAIGQRFGLDGPIFEPIREDEDQDVDADIFHLQAAHSRSIAEAKYARYLGSGAGIVQTRSDRYQLLSTRWHQILGLASRPAAGRSNKHYRSVSDQQQQLAIRSRIKRLKHLKQMDLDQTLISIFGPGSSYRYQQRSILEAICGTTNQPPAARIVAILPTGAGKSLLFMIPALQRMGGLSIVIVPLVSLKNDLFRRLVFDLSGYRFKYLYNLPVQSNLADLFCLFEKI